MPIYMNKLQVQYAELESIAKMLSAEAEEIEQMLSKLAQGVEYLEGGAWEGQAANAFYGEMRELVLPGMRKLSTRLEDVGSLMQQINKHFQDAEQQAGNLFKNDGAMKFAGAFNMSSGGDMKFSTDSFKFGDGSVHKFGDGSLKIMPAGGNVGDSSLKFDYMKFGGGADKFASGGGGSAGDNFMKYGDNNMAKFGDSNITDGSSMKFDNTGMAKFSPGDGAGTNAMKFEGTELNGDG